MRERLSPLDAMFLYIERPHVHMGTGGLSIYDPGGKPGGRLTRAELKHLVACRIHLAPRFRKKVVFPPFGTARPAWIDDPAFDLDYHIREVAVPPPGGRRELEDLVERIQSVPLDRERPLWELYLIQGLSHGRVAVLTRTHHALVDGIGGVDLVTGMFELTPKTPVEHPRRWHPEPEPTPRQLLTEALREQATNPVGAAWHAADAVRRSPRRVAQSTAMALEGIATWLRGGPIPASGPFNTTVGMGRRFAMSEVQQADARAIKAALGGTTNDVVLAALTGAIRQLLRSRHVDVQGMELRAMIPVSVRGPGDDPAVGNHVSAFFVDLPVGESLPRKRLQLIADRTRRLKQAHESLAGEVLLGVSGLTGAPLQAVASHLLASQHFAHLVVSNIPGPDLELYLCGARHLATYPVMPLAENIGLSIAVVSLGGVMGFGFTGDRDTMPDLDSLADNLVESFAALKHAADRVSRPRPRVRAHRAE